MTRSELKRLLVICGLVLLPILIAAATVPVRKEDSRGSWVEFSTGNRVYWIRESAIQMVSFPIESEKGQRTSLLIGATRIETDWTQAEFKEMRDGVNDD